MQPYYIYTTKTETTKYPIEWHAHNTNKAPLKHTTYMKATY